MKRLEEARGGGDGGKVEEGGGGREEFAGGLSEVVRGEGASISHFNGNLEAGFTVIV